MVLGLGSRSKKERLSTSASPPPDLDLRLLEIRPWHGFHTPKASSSVILRCSRGDKLLGSTRSASPKVATAVDSGKIVFNETFRIPAAVSRDSSKRSRKSSGNSEMPLVFHLVETNNVKGQPLAHASLNLATYASIEEAKTIDIQLILSRKVSSKGASCYLHVTVQRHQDHTNSGPGSVAVEQHINPPVSSVTSTSSRTSEASSPPPLDDVTHQKLVEALLSDEDDEIASFTDDEISQGSGASQDNVTGVDAPEVRLSETTQTATNSQVKEVTETYRETAEVRISQPVISSPQASPVKAAAAAAAAAYATKRSLLSRDTSSFVASPYDLSSEPASPGDDGFLTPDSAEARSPNLLSKNYFAGNLSTSLTSPTMGGSEKVRSSASATGVATIVKAHEQSLKIVFDEKKQLLEADTGSKELLKERNSVGEAIICKAVEGNPAKGNEKPKPDCNSSGYSDIKVAPGSSKARVGNTTSNAVRGAGEDKAVAERKNPVSEKERSLSSGDTVKAVSKTPSLNNGRLFEPSFEQKQSLAKNLIKESVVEKINKPNGGSEIAKAQAGSRLQEVQNIEDQYQQKSLIETKAKVSVKASTKEDSVQQAKMTVRGNTVGNTEKTDKTAAEAAKTLVARAEAKVAAAEAKVQHLEKQVEQLQGELRDVAAVEAALYSNTTEHGSSSLKVHSPARRLTRLYIYACKHWSQERRASCARNTVGGLVLVARACGHDVARLTFWWSNTVVLRETISMAFDVSASSLRLETVSSRLKSPGKGRDLHIAGEKNFQDSHSPSPAAISEDWREQSTFIAALERVEAWIYAKVVESIWWQVLMPHMQQSVDASLLKDGVSENVSLYGRRNGKRSLALELMDGKQGNTSIEIWKKAFVDAYERLCPVRAIGVECGCLPMLIKMVLEECVVRLDVAMFNAILRGYDNEAPTDPVSDPISDARVLPIPISTLSFGIGAQLKSVVGILSAWLMDLLIKESGSIMTSQIPEDDEQSLVMFPLLKATGDLLMLPKEMLQDRALRKEICPFLSLPFIGRILLNFKPDEFSPEPVTPELLEAINSEISADNERRGELDYNVTALRIATAPPVVYFPPQSSVVRNWIGDPNSYHRLNRSNSSLLRKGHTSDDELDELESPISWLWENTTGLISGGHSGLIAGFKDSSHMNEKLKDTAKEDVKNCRFELLRDVWNTDLMKYL